MYYNPLFTTCLSFYVNMRCFLAYLMVVGLDRGTIRCSERFLKERCVQNGLIAHVTYYSYSAPFGITDVSRMHFLINAN